MGQAKKRGTFEQRQQEAYDKVDAHIDIRKKELEEFTKFEERQMEVMGQYIEKHVFRSLAKNRNPIAQTLLRADFSQINLGYLSNGKQD